MWEGVPWAIGGEAQHDAEVARVLSYVAARGAEGVVGPWDLKVTATEVPSAAVRVETGACSILSRSAGSGFEGYVARMKTVDTVPIAPTTSSGPRSDLIVARIENPYASGESWAFPSTRATGPYVFTRPIANVPPGTTSLAGIRPNDSAIPLARIDLPASTSTITQEMITDLRSLIAPRQSRQVITANPGGQYDITNPALVTWTDIAAAATIPDWATTCRMLVHITGLGRSTSATQGQIRARLGSEVTAATAYQLDAGSASEVVAVTVAGTLDVASLAGSRTLRLEASRTTGFGGILRAFPRSMVTFDLQFEETLG